MSRTEYISATRRKSFANPRESVRYDMVELIAVVDRGTGKVLNISEGGMSFGCLFAHHFEKELLVDLLDAYGTHITRIPVRKIWERRGRLEGCSDEFELEVGVEFMNLSGIQKASIHNLLDFTSPYQNIHFVASEVF